MEIKTEIEKLIYLKEGQIEDKLYFIFTNIAGEFRAVNAETLNITQLCCGKEYSAVVKRKGCSGREITEILV